MLVRMWSAQDWDTSVSGGKRFDHSEKLPGVFSQLAVCTFVLGPFGRKPCARMYANVCSSIVGGKRKPTRGRVSESWRSLTMDSTALQINR